MKPAKLRRFVRSLLPRSGLSLLIGCSRGSHSVVEMYSDCAREGEMPMMDAARGLAERLKTESVQREGREGTRDVDAVSVAVEWIELDEAVLTGEGRCLNGEREPARQGARSA